MKQMKLYWNKIYIQTKITFLFFTFLLIFVSFSSDIDNVTWTVLAVLFYFIVFAIQLFSVINEKSSTKRTINITRKNLNNYKNNFVKLNDTQLKFYKKTLYLQLEHAKKISYVVNNTTDIKKFVSGIREIISILEILSEHEYTGWFLDTPPSQILSRTKNDMHLTEITFIKRSFPSSIDERVEKKKKYHKYLENFTPQAISYFDTGYEASKDFSAQIIKKMQEVSIEDKDIIKINKGDFASVQRICKVGFNRALEIMEQLEKRGTVEYSMNTGTRKILVYAEESSPLPSASENVNLYTNKYDYMEGHDFEYFCADLLIKNGYNDVSVTSGSGDQGIDVIAFKNGVKYGIQCKRYSADVGNKAVQEVYSGAKFYDCHVPVVLTNRHFTKSAIDLAKKTNVLLWDRNELNKLIENI